MATAAQWVQGARPATLPNAVAPVVAGVGAAAAVAEVAWLRAVLALLVALSLIVGVNYANDYSDGVRGTDTDRVGPLRLVGSGAADPATVRAVAIGCLATAALVGTVLVALTGRWWLLAVGLGCIAAAWTYTGGRRPYGYSGLGEVAVFVFFGPVAVVGTQFVVAEQVSGAGVATGVAVGCLSAAVLVANNLRDIPTDAATGKRTLAVALGDRRTRMLYAGLVAVPFAVTAGLAVGVGVVALAGLLAAPLVALPARRVLAGEGGRALVPVLRATGLAMLAWATVTAAALAGS